MIISWHEILSWIITVVSATLFFTERRKNDNTKYYMVLQGILRACGQRSGFLANTVGRLQESRRDVPCEEFNFVLNSELRELPPASRAHHGIHEVASTG